VPLLPPSGNNFQTFGNDGAGVGAALTDPGNNYPTFGQISLIPGAPVLGGLDPLTFFSPPVPTNNGTPFGGGGITAFSVSGGGSGGGVAWFPYLLSDELQGAFGTASAVYSFYSANLQNLTNTAFLNVPGVFILAVQGIIPNKSFVAASIRGAIGGQIEDVTFASTGPAGPAGFCNQPPTFIADNTGINDCFSENVAGGTFFQAFGVSEVGPFNLLPGGVINVNATVSLLADPGAEIEVAMLPPDILSRLPADFIGAQAAIPAPEPCTALLLGTGILGIWARKRRRAARNQGTVTGKLCS
jgi:hypothetical protein